jgi:serine/threonine protein kinase
MEETRRDELGLLLEQALAMPVSERSDFLDGACAHDSALRMEAASLLAAFESSRIDLDELAEQVIAPLLPGAVEDDIVIGERLAQYEIVERVGVGGMGVVYRALDLRLDRAVALKFLPPAAAASPEARARLLVEARALSALDHPNIGVVHEVAETPSGQSFIALGWYDGETLRNRLRRGPLDVADAVAIAHQIAAALEAAHQAGIIHRDVKPSNILITTQGVPKLLDFGIAKTTGAEPTREGRTYGTVAYMSPEQTYGEPVDPRTDQWSLGVVLYEMLTGQRPFRGERDEVVIHAIRHDPAEPLARLRPDAPAALIQVVDTCLAKDRDGRYEHTGALVAALQQPGSSDASTGWALASRGARSRPHARQSRSPKLAAALAAAAIAVVALAMAVVYPMVTRTDSPPLDPQRVLVSRFENHTGRASLDPLGSMAADWIIQGLAQTGRAQVVPVSAALSASLHVDAASAGTDGSGRIRLLADETGAGIVVSGAYYQQGDSLYLRANATDVTRGQLLFALEPLAAPIDQPMVGFEQLRQRMLNALAPHVDARLQQWTIAPSQQVPDYAAYEAFADGLDLFIAGQWRAATARFGEAGHDDANFAAPLFFSALAFINLGDFAAVDSIVARATPQLHRLTDAERSGFAFVAALARGDLAGAYRAQLRNAERFPGGLGHWGLANASLWVNRPHETIRISRKLDPERGELRGWFLYWRELTRAHHRLEQHREELRVARRARELFPDEPQAVLYEVQALAALRRTRELRVLLADQLQTYPEPAVLLRRAGLELLAHGATADARTLLRESLQQHLTRPSGTPGFRLFLADAHMLLGELDEAAVLLDALVAEQPELAPAHAAAGRAAALRGNAEEAARIALWLAAPERGRRGWHTFQRARIAALLNESDEAVRLLRQAFSEGFEPWDLLHVEPDFDGLRDYPGYRDFARPVG